MKRITKQYAQELIEILRENDNVHSEVIRYSTLSRTLFSQIQVVGIDPKSRFSEMTRLPISVAGGNSLDEFKEYFEGHWKIHEDLYQYMTFQDFKKHLGEITEEL